MNPARRRHVAAVALLTALTALIALATTTASATPAQGRSGAPGASASAPGRRTAVPAPIELAVPVNIVLIGYDIDEVGPGLLSRLAPSGEPVVRSPSDYGLTQPVGLHYDYDYQLLELPSRLTNRFFGHQLRTGTNDPVTAYQAAYNGQAHNRLDVTGPILANDARDTQHWLDQHAAPGLGIDLEHSYTVYLVNWWDRADFRFHNYHLPSAVDPDTGIDWANDLTPFPFVPTNHREQSALSGWGGTTTRSWFYDLSAGPDFYAQNWDVDHADFDGDGVADYRMPPVWEYAADGYRPRSALPGDLGSIVRYVAVNLLFTASPLYDPMAYQPKAGAGFQLHTTIFEGGDPAVDGDARTDTPYAAARVHELEPWVPMRTTNRDVPTRPADLWTAAQGILYGTPQAPGGCWQAYGTPYAALWCTLREQHAMWLPRQGRDTLLPSFLLTGSDAELFNSSIRGYAAPDFTTGRPTYAMQFLAPIDLAYGIGNTTVTSHEVGHLLGASHPHDGYDPATSLYYSARGDRFYSWIGDQSESLMNYTRLTHQFSVFDDDNIARDVYAGYLANMEPAGQRTPAQQSLVDQADTAFADWRFQDAATLARQAWAGGAAALPLTARWQAALAAVADGVVPPAPGDEPQRTDLGQEGKGSGPLRPGPQPSLGSLGRR